MRSFVLLSLLQLASATLVCHPNAPSCNDLSLYDTLEHNLPDHPYGGYHRSLWESRADITHDGGGEHLVVNKGTILTLSDDDLPHVDERPEDLLDPSPSSSSSSSSSFLSYLSAYFPLSFQASASPPATKTNSTHALMIDAGSGGSRLHVYEFARREFSTIPPPISDVTTDSSWTSRLKPGLSSFKDTPEEDLPLLVAEYLYPLIDFARLVLREKEEDWGEFHLYLKATGGMRTLSHHTRMRIMNTVRDLFKNEIAPILFANTTLPVKWHNPFLFSFDEQARIISGEEEAIYGWTAINYLMGTLLENEAGFGAVTAPNKTFGALDLGGASTQISFFQPDEDVVANLFKMQVASKHWNVYAHSFLYFGANLARERMGARIVWETDLNNGVGTGESPTYINPCLPSDKSAGFTSKIHFLDDGIESWRGLSATGKDAEEYSVTFSPDQSASKFDSCHKYSTTLLRKESNAWCEFAHGGDCSFAGVYQPGLPRQTKQFGDFFAFANYLHIWKFLRLEIRATVSDLKDAAENVCGMSWSELKEFNGARASHLEDLDKYCFLSTYAYAMLTTGYGFHLEDFITTASVINNQKVGWPLGSTLYEINTLKWKYKGDLVTKSMGLSLGFMVTFLIACCCVLALQLFRVQRKRGMSTFSLVPNEDFENEQQNANYGAIA